MKALKLLITAVAALALLAIPAGALAKRDHNHDRIPDKWEKRFHLSTRVNVARQDPDHDGLTNIAEFRDNTNPRKADTDDDGVGDKQEIEDRTNPDDAESNDATEISGTVTSFDGTTLVIQPSDGSAPVSGVVNPQTEVECDDASQPTASASDDGPGDDGDRSGSTTTTTSGSGDSGDDDQGGDDQGEDDQQQCTIAAGDFVHEAKFVTGSSGNTFTKVELGH